MLGSVWQSSVSLIIKLWLLAYLLLWVMSGSVWQSSASIVILLILLVYLLLWVMLGSVWQSSISLVIKLWLLAYLLLWVMLCSVWQSSVSLVIKLWLLVYLLLWVVLGSVWQSFCLSGYQVIPVTLLLFKLCLAVFCSRLSSYCWQSITICVVEKKHQKVTMFYNLQTTASTKNVFNGLHEHAFRQIVPVISVKSWCSFYWTS